MITIIKELFNLLPESLKNDINNFRTINRWKKQGKPIPTPHVVKQNIIKEYQKKYRTTTLVETGTYLGEMVFAQKNNFKKIYSIELGEELWKNAVEKFKSFQHVEILKGDSGVVLKDLVPKLNTPALFWLDGHYSAGITAKGEKECPIYEELDAIYKSHFHHILLIDDARCFNGEGDYPSVPDLKKYILSKRSQSIIEIKDDVIRVTIERL